MEACSRASDLLAREFERILTGRAPLLFGALPDHARKTFQRHQRLTGIGPFLQLFDRDMVERLAPGAPRKQRARDIDHAWRARTLIDQRRAALRAETAHGVARLVLIARDRRLTLGDAKALAPTADIGRIGRAMRAAADGGMIMPSPACRHVDLEGDLTAEALALCDAGWCCG